MGTVGKRLSPLSGARWDLHSPHCVRSAWGPYPCNGSKIHRVTRTMVCIADLARVGNRRYAEPTHDVPARSQSRQNL